MRLAPQVVRRGAPLSLAVSAGFTHDAVGATLGDLPTGFHHVDRRYPLPVGSFDRAATALLDWSMHRASGLRVAAEPLAPGSAVQQAFGVGPVELLAPCRVVSLVDVPGGRGLVYGTVEGHPESGEESFVVRTADGHTWLEVRSFSRPGSWLTALGGPAAHWVQSRAVDGYGAALRRLL